MALLTGTGCIRSFPASHASSAPTNVHAVPDIREAHVSWTAPADDGGFSVQSYRVTPIHGTTRLPAVEVAGNQTQAAVPDLADGTMYSFAVAARNGFDSNEGYSEIITTFDRPAPASNVIASRGPAMAVVQWNGSPDDGGSPLTGYAVSTIPATTEMVVASNQTGVTLDGLVNGVSYTVSVVAQNAVGDSLPAFSALPVVPADLPSAPQNAAAAGANHQVTVSWLAPASTGGIPITGYTVSGSGPGITVAPVTVSGSTLSLTVGSLLNGKSYQFSVFATNGLGNGPAATANAVIPATAPTAPLAVSVQKHPARVSWAAPFDDGGSAITHYVVTPFAGTTAGTPIIAGGGATGANVSISASGTYTFQVVAQNAVGNGPAGTSAPATFSIASCGLYGLADTIIGGEVKAVALGDLDGDGILDEVVADAGTVYLLHGRGDGTFARVQSLPVGGSIAVTSLAVADFDGDGKRDVAIGEMLSGFGRVDIRFGNGGGTLTGTSLVLNLNIALASIATGDANGDGKLDIVTGGAGSELFLGNGAGSYADAGFFTASQTLNSRIAVSDIDGDGYDDVLLPDNSEVEIRWGAPLSPFSTGTILQPGDQATGVTVADVDGDGLRDVIASTYSTGLAVFPAMGARTFAARQTVTALTHNLQILSGDFDGDGHADLIASAREAFVVLLGNGDGSFAPAARYGGAADNDGVALLGDIDADGAPDVILGTGGSNRVLTFRGAGDGTFASAISTSLSTTPVGVASADVNADGIIDLVVAEPSANAAQILLGAGNGTFSDGGTLPVGTSPMHVVVADFDGDGKPDIASTDSSTGAVSVMIGNGAGVFAPKLETVVSASLPPVDLAVADFNGDAMRDLVVTLRSNPPTFDTVKALVASGSGNFTVTTLTAQASGPTVVADFNGDGRSDVATVVNGARTIYLRTAGGSFSTQPVTSTCAIQLAADVDGDGVIDVIDSDPATDAVRVCKGISSTTFAAPATIFVRGGALLRAARDFDGDGAVDIIGTGAYGETMIAWGDGAGGFIAETFAITDTSTEELAIADFDGNGRLDVAAAGNATIDVGLVSCTR